MGRFLFALMEVHKKRVINRCPLFVAMDGSNQQLTIEDKRFSLKVNFLKFSFEHGMHVSFGSAASADQEKTK